MPFATAILKNLDDRRIIELDEDLTRFLSRLRPSAGETVAWFGGRMPLRVASYLSAELPPLAYISSVRALLLRDNMVMTVRDAGGTTHLLPGGRREVGETLEQTLRREIREETGWSVGQLTPLGFLHYHHEGAIPKNYAYPYPDFLQAVYAAEADTFDEGDREKDGHELDVRFRTFDDAIRLPISLGNRVFLRAVMSQQPPVRSRP